MGEQPNYSVYPAGWLKKCLADNEKVDNKNRPLCLPLLKKLAEACNENAATTY